MNILRSFALNTQYALCHRKRARTVARMAKENRAPISVLFYHRVADRHPNDWTISHAQFVRHIEYCRTHFEIISLGEAQRRLQTAQSPRPAIAITFDDGYAENMEFAIPWLLQNNVPVTYFVTTEHVRTGKPFAHDVKCRQPLPINSIADIRSASDLGVDIGVHSATHVDFSTVRSRRELEAETIDAKMDLEMMIGREARYFAVPFGMPKHLRPALMQLVRESGMKGICSAYGAYNLVGNDPFHIRRLHGDTSFIRLRNWLGFDQRKVKQELMLPSEDELLSDHPPEATPGELSGEYSGEMSEALCGECFVAHQSQLTAANGANRSETSALLLPSPGELPSNDASLIPPSFAPTV